MKSKIGTFVSVRHNKGRYRVGFLSRSGAVVDELDIWFSTEVEADRMARRMNRTFTVIEVAERLGVSGVSEAQEPQENQEPQVGTLEVFELKEDQR